MQFGAVFPTCEIGDDPVRIRDWAQAAESLGYGYIVAYDHVLGAVHEGRDPRLPGPYTEEHPFHEPFVLFGYLAGVTESIEFETAVIIAPQRQTALLAKQAAQVDVLSGGRLRLGLGSGWNHVEYEALGVPWQARGRRLDEQVEVLRALWSDDVVSYDGEFHRIDRAGIAPRPAHDIPIWFGGGPGPAARRAARVGDGFTFAGAGRGALGQVEAMREMLSDGGRDPSQFGFEFNLAYGLGPDKWVGLTDGAREGGISHMCVNTMSATAEWAGTPPSGLESVDDHIAGLERFIGAVR